MKRVLSIIILATLVACCWFMVLSCNGGGGGGGRGAPLYMQGNDGTYGYEPWVFRGLEVPQMMADIASGNAHSDPGYFTRYDGKVYFRARTDDAGSELWAYDGSSAYMVTDLTGDAQSSLPVYLTELNGIIYFSGRIDHPKVDLCAFDAASSSAWVVTGIYAGGDVYPSYLTVMEDKLYFAAYDGVHGRELWVYDGINAPVRKSDINTTGTSDVSHIAAIGDQVCFSADDGAAAQREPWCYNETAGAANMIADINSKGGSSPNWFTECNGRLFFQASNGLDGSELWAYDGIGAPVMVADIHTTGSSTPQWLTCFKSDLYFEADDGVSGRELWVFDTGTDSAMMVTDIRTGPDGSNPTGIDEWPFAFPANEEFMYFGANDGATGVEPYVFDGSEVQKVFEPEINPSGDFWKVVF